MSRNGREKFRSKRRPERWNCGETGNINKNYRAQTRDKNDVNAVTNKVQDALLLFVDSPFDSWNLDFGA